MVSITASWGSRKVFGIAIFLPVYSFFLHVNLKFFDKDLLYDDWLGESVTDADGEFYILYHENDFKDLIERQPDLYLKVMNKKGKVLYTSEKAARWQSDRVEYFEIEMR